VVTKKEEKQTFDKSIRDGASFWAAASERLETCCSTPILAEAITQSLEEEHYKFIHSLSLDDIEKLATALKLVSNPQ
jgi:hypothetical protein